MSATSVGASLPAGDARPDVVQLAMLKASMQAQATMTSQLLQSLPQPASDGRSGGQLDAYA